MAAVVGLLQWLAPSEALRLSTEKELKLSPPQLSELVQLKR